MFREEVGALNKELNHCLLRTDFIGVYATQFRPKVLITPLNPCVFPMQPLSHAMNVYHDYGFQFCSDCCSFLVL